MKARKFELKSLDTQGEKFDYQEILKLIVEMPDQGRGIQIAEMRKRIKILDNIESANGSVHFTQEEWAELKKTVSTFPWGKISREIVQFCDDLEAAPEVELKEN